MPRKKKGKFTDDLRKNLDTLIYKDPAGGDRWGVFWQYPNRRGTFVAFNVDTGEEVAEEQLPAEVAKRLRAEHDRRSSDLKERLRPDALTQWENWERRGPRWPLDKALNEILRLDSRQKAPIGIGLPDDFDFDNVRRWAKAEAAEGNLDMIEMEGELFVHIQSLILWALDNFNYWPAGTQREMFEIMVDSWEEGASLDWANGPDFRFVRLRGRKYPLTPSQAAVIGILREAYDNKTPDVGWAYLQERCSIASNRISETFKSLKGWEDLITDGQTKGTYRLNLP